MGWFSRQVAGRAESEVNQEHGRYLRAAGVQRALDALAGPFGVRRFLVYFAKRGEQVRITRVDAVPLAWGGGPPARDDNDALDALEASLGRLHRNMGTGPRWESGAIGYTRDLNGRINLYPLFDEDAEDGLIDQLPVPGPPGHPLEDPAYLRQLADLEHRIVELQGRTASRTTDFDSWEILDDQRLELTWDEPRDVQRHRCEVLATLNLHHSYHRWAFEKPPFDDPLFLSRGFGSTMAASMEACMLLAVRLRAQWVFAHPLEDDQIVLFAAVFA